MNQNAKKSNPAKSFALGALFGAVAGIVTGFLTSPKSGKENREFVAKKAGEAKDFTVEKAGQVTDFAKTKVGDAKVFAGEKAEVVSEKARGLFGHKTAKPADKSSATGKAGETMIDKE